MRMYSAYQVHEDSVNFTHSEYTHTNPDVSHLEGFVVDIEGMATGYDVIVFTLTGIVSRLLLIFLLYHVLSPIRGM
jgi:hypothetical protein